MKVTSVPATQSAKVIEFYQPVRKSAWGAACLDGLARPWCGARPPAIRDRSWWAMENDVEMRTRLSAGWHSDRSDSLLLTT